MKNIAILFGGQSSEHEVSCMSAINIIKQIDKSKYVPYLIGITKEGEWLLVEDVKDIENNTWRESKTHAQILPDATKKSILLHKDGIYTHIYIDVAFPVLHGLYGEDGTVQGLLSMANIPYVGCGVLASAVAMDKLYTKIIVDTLGIRQAAYVPILKKEVQNDIDACMDRVEEKLSYPVFIKPSNAGSSKGVNKAGDRQTLLYALQEAILHDRKVLVEETIIGREVECAVLGIGYEAKASGIGEVISAGDFYDYDSKYNDAMSKTITNPVLPDGIEEKLRDDAKQIFGAIDGFGLSRVDFFVTKENEVVFNEINTMPGFTAISMYPMLWEEKGIDKSALVEALIALAYERE